MHTTTMTQEVTEKSEVKDPKFVDFLAATLKPIEEEKTPETYAVILHNDDTTPYQLVVNVLREVFGLTRNRAEVVMMTAHEEGQCAVVILAEEEAKALLVEAKTASVGTTLTFSMEKE